MAEASGIPSMYHLNGNVLCSVGIRTTGKEAKTHDLVQACAIPLDNFLKPISMPFYMDIQPKRLERITKETYKSRLSWDTICDIATNGIEPYMGVDMFEEWFMRLGLKEGKRIVPLAFEWDRQIGFWIDWLGFKTFDYLFVNQVRDLKTVALFCNDRSNTFGEQVLYPKHNLVSDLLEDLKVEHDDRQDLINDCAGIAEAYRRMIGYMVH